MGIREYTSWWISGARVLFSVAPSISLTLSPLTSHLSGLSGIYGSTELPLLGVRDVRSVLLLPVQKDNSRIVMGKQIKRRRNGLMWMFLLQRDSILHKLKIIYEPGWKCFSSFVFCISLLPQRRLWEGHMWDICPRLSCYRCAAVGRVHDRDGGAGTMFHWFLMLHNQKIKPVI